MKEQPYFTVGQPIAIRHLYKGKIFSALPAIVVRDDDHLIALYIQVGTKWKIPVDKQHKRVTLLCDMWTLEDSIWIENVALELVIPGEAHSVFILWRQTDHRLMNWYVNFQEPLRRSPCGFDSLDQELDIVISPDLQYWEWKDRELFEELVHHHVFLPEQTAAIWGEAYKVISQIEAHKHPLIGSDWQAWLPDKRWTLPTLPQQWYKIEKV